MHDQNEIIKNWENLVAQIEAIQANDYPLYFKLAKDTGPLQPNPGGTTAYIAWEFGAVTKRLSLFRNLPGCYSCLTEAKQLIHKKAAYPEIKNLDKKLGFSTNKLIPLKPTKRWNPKPNQLYEFAGLQLIVEYGEAACRKAGVLEC